MWYKKFKFLKIMFKKNFDPNSYRENLVEKKEETLKKEKKEISKKEKEKCPVCNKELGFMGWCQNCRMKM